MTFQRRQKHGKREKSVVTTGFGWRGSEYKNAVMREFSGNVHIFLFSVCGDGYKNLCKYKNSIVQQKSGFYSM